MTMAWLPKICFLKTQRRFTIFKEYNYLKIASKNRNNNRARVSFLVNLNIYYILFCSFIFLIYFLDWILNYDN